MQRQRVSMRATITDNAGQCDSTPKLHCRGRQPECHCLSGSINHQALSGFLSAFVLLFCVGIMQARAADELTMSPIDTATTQRSDKGLYEVSFDSIDGPIVINTIHEWRLTVVSTEGVPVDGLTITIDGGMPMHDHGLPTAPRVTESLGEGQYRVEGFKFQMPGHWTTTFNLTDNGNSSDSVTFNLML